MTPALIRTLEWDSDKVRCTTCGLPWAEHPDSRCGCGVQEHHCHTFVNVRAVWWVKEEIRR